ncbi:MAG: Rrf2 family transcriptional regulator [Alphaproteobacteria bacterium]|nr:Rrf2 family transcriptional regulator [Alphaproteobacteria bacterium]
MRLTLQTDYALRILMFAGIRGDALSTIDEIVTRFDISRGHAMKVVHRLGQKGYLRTVRGKNGGMRLARIPSQINVGAVVRDMEGELGVLGCLQDEKEFCRIQTCCVLRGALHEATKAFLTALDVLTIADLIKPHRSMTKLLDLDRSIVRSSRLR